MPKKSALHTERKVGPKLDHAPIPFEEALRRMVNAPPQHKVAKKKAAKPTKQ